MVHNKTTLHCASEFDLALGRDYEAVVVLVIRLRVILEPDHAANEFFTESGPWATR